MSYSQISTDQRNELSALLGVATKKRVISQQLNKDRTTIWRELQILTPKEV